MLVAGAFTAPATTIYAARVKDGVVIAADGLKRYVNGGKTVSQEKVCKIHRSDRIVWAASGLSDYLDFSLDDLVAESVRGRSVTAAAAHFRSIAPARLQQALATAQRRNPAEYAQWTAKPTLNVVFAGWEGDLPVLSVLEFRAPGGRVSVSESRCPGTCGAADGSMWVATGVHEHLSTRLKDLVKPGVSPPLTLVRDVMEEQIRATPDRVGPPIAILVWGRPGQQWWDGVRGACAP
jgi:hypothetical protein